MYHKQPYGGESLSEWVHKLNNEHHANSSGAQFGWKISKYRPKPPEPTQKSLKVEIPKVKAYEATFEVKEKPMKLVEKLKQERQEYLEKILKMDDKIITPVGISEYQVNYLKAQRNAMMTIINVLDLRIADLED